MNSINLLLSLACIEKYTHSLKQYNLLIFSKCQGQETI
jgi:hypothetical protein